MRIPLAAALFLVSSIAGADCRTATVRGATLSVADETAQRVVIGDRQGVLRPRFSPDGGRVAYHTRVDGNGEGHVRIVDVATNQVVTDIRVDPSLQVIHKLGWRADGDLWASSNTTYVQFDSVSGAVRDRIHGLAFSVSPDRTRVAHLSDTPPRVLMIDGRTVGKFTGELSGPILWSRSGDSVTVREDDLLVQVTLTGARLGAIAAPVQHVVTTHQALTSDGWCAPE